MPTPKLPIGSGMHRAKRNRSRGPRFIGMDPASGPDKTVVIAAPKPLRLKSLSSNGGVH